MFQLVGRETENVGRSQCSYEKNQRDVNETEIGSHPDRVISTHKSKNNKTQRQKFIKSFKCPKCEEEFLSSDSLKSHLEIHIHGKENYICVTCNEVFSNKEEIVEHVNLHLPKSNDMEDLNLNNVVIEKQRGKTPEMRFKCYYCGKSFAKKPCLEIHIRRHLGIKPFVCKVCSKGFVWSSKLRDHLDTHSGLKRHKCHMCDKLFRLRHHLQDHLMLHRGEKRFKCEICSKGFIQ